MATENLSNFFIQEKSFCNKLKNDQKPTKFKKCKKQINQNLFFQPFTNLSTKTPFFPECSGRIITLGLIMVETKQLACVHYASKRVWLALFVLGRVNSACKQMTIQWEKEDKTNVGERN